MPTYQYSCTECGHFLEAFQSFSDDSLTECPECGGRLRKVFNAVGVVFKGSGFYRNDSRGAEKTAEPAAASTSGDDGAKKAEKSPAEKTAAKSASNGSGDSGSSSTRTEAKSA